MRTTSRRSIRSPVLAFAALLALALPAWANTYSAGSVVLASGPSPFASCDVSTQPGTLTAESELEPMVAVNPIDPLNIVGLSQQDRWSNGGAKGLSVQVSKDGGSTWTTVVLPKVSACSGGTSVNGNDYERASDPWISFGPDGVLYAISLSFDVSTARSSILELESHDGGVTWSDPIALVRNDTFYASNDKESIAADPGDARYVYAVWDRSRFSNEKASDTSQFHSFAFRGDILFSRTTDGGSTWTTQTIFRPQDNEFTIGNQILVLPDGTLIDGTALGKGSGGNRPGNNVAVLRSTDKGATWTAPLIAAQQLTVGTVDPDTGAPIRDGGGLPEFAVDRNPSSPGYGDLYAVWQDSRFSKAGHTHDDVVFSTSSDGGLTWSSPVKINKTPGEAGAFTPSIAVASDGTIGVTYYDFRQNTPAPGALTDAWFVHCHPSSGCTDPSQWSETHVAGSFDIERAPIARGYFLGDYEGLKTAGNDFIAFFAQTTATDPDNVYFTRISVP